MPEADQWSADCAGVGVELDGSSHGSWETGAWGPLRAPLSIELLLARSGLRGVRLELVPNWFKSLGAETAQKIKNC